VAVKKKKNEAWSAPYSKNLKKKKGGGETIQKTNMEERGGKKMSGKRIKMKGEVDEKGTEGVKN